MLWIIPWWKSAEYVKRNILMPVIPQNKNVQGRQIELPVKKTNQNNKNTEKVPSS